MAEDAWRELVEFLPAVRVRSGKSEQLRERVALEVPLELRINGHPHTLLMTSPGLVEELALGYLLSSGFIRGAEQVRGMDSGWVELPGAGRALWVDVSLPPEAATWAQVRRVTPAASSCGLCGLESLDDLCAEVPPVKDDRLRVGLPALFRLFAAMRRGQEVFRHTGGTHAAALGHPSGELLFLAEDIGRHNALDKVIGQAARQGVDPGGCVCVLSGRFSYEMALKAARVGIPVVGSVSAPTNLGLELLKRLGITLVGFAREPRATIFTHPQRILTNGQTLEMAEE